MARTKVPVAPRPYDDDLAYVHDQGFGEYPRAAARRLIAALRKQRHASGLVVELGSGSGIVSRPLIDAGYNVLGFDISASMVELARRNVPEAEYRCASFVDAPLPRSVAVAAIGEVFNYLFDAANTRRQLPRMIRKVHAALEPGGVFVFDLSGPGRAGPGGVRAFREADDWACLFSAEEDPRTQSLTRRITTFRRLGDTFRRAQETHRLRLYERTEVTELLRAAGFQVHAAGRYDDVKLPKGMTAYTAVKAR